VPWRDNQSKRRGGKVTLASSSPGNFFRVVSSDFLGDQSQHAYTDRASRSESTGDRKTTDTAMNSTNWGFFQTFIERSTRKGYDNNEKVNTWHLVTSCRRGWSNYFIIGMRAYYGNFMDSVVNLAPHKYVVPWIQPCTDWLLLIHPGILINFIRVLTHVLGLSIFLIANLNRASCNVTRASYFAKKKKIKLKGYIVSKLLNFYKFIKSHCIFILINDFGSIYLINIQQILTGEGSSTSAVHQWLLNSDF
jgi:hypothetical protein